MTTRRTTRFAYPRNDGDPARARILLSIETRRLSAMSRAGSTRRCVRWAALPAMFIALSWRARPEGSTSFAESFRVWGSGGHRFRLWRQLVYTRWRTSSAALSRSSRRRLR